MSHATEDTTEDLRYMRDPDLWGCFPKLPLKRRRDGETWPQLGVMICHTLSGATPEPITIYLGTMFDIDLRKRPTLEYPTVEAAIADGWRVD